DEGRREYERALQLDPNSAQACSLYGKFLLETATGPDSLSRAEELLKRATKGPVDRPGQVHFNLGQLYTQRAQYKEAIEALRESLRIEPADERAFYALANVYRRM